ncbi:MAG TPA: aminoglycoside phosphotransferase family protein [Nakamurella sp.]
MPAAPDHAGPGWGRAVRRLVDQGIISARAALDGATVVDLVTRSNQLALLSVDGRPVVAVKRHRSGVTEHDTMATERDAYLAVGRHADRPIAPKLLDHGDGTLTIDAAAGRPLNEVLGVGTDPGEESAILRALGRTLADLHRLPRDGFSAREPWLLGVPDGRAPANLHGDPGLVAFLGDIADNDTLGPSIRRLRGIWRPLVPLHGDVKFDNVLVARQTGGPHVTLIDWELAGLGPPAWDLAGVLDGLLLPGLVAGGVTGAISRLRFGEAALDEYRNSTAGSGAVGRPVDGADLAVAAVARLAQSAIQLAAMAGEHVDHRRIAADLVAASAELAKGIVEAPWINSKPGRRSRSPWTTSIVTAPSLPIPVS